MQSDKHTTTWRVGLATVLALSALAACGGTSSSGGTSTAATTSTTATATTCDQSVQPSCPSTVPSYSGQITTIISTYCLECHDPNGIGAVTSAGAGGMGGGGGGGGARPGDPNFGNDPNLAGNPNLAFNQNANNWDPSDAHDWTKYANIKANATLMEQQVFLCYMPPSGAVAMTAADRQTLLDWLACGAPNN